MHRIAREHNDTVLIIVDFILNHWYVSSVWLDPWLAKLSLGVFTT